MNRQYQDFLYIALSVKGDLRHFPRAERVSVRFSYGGALEPHIPSKLAEDHDYWMRHCLNMAGRCDSILVYCIDGWKESKGVQMEIEYAKTSKMPLKYLWPTDDFVPPDIRDAAPEMQKSTA